MGIVLLDGVGYIGGDDEAVGEWIWNGERVILRCKGIVYLSVSAAPAKIRLKPELQPAAMPAKPRHMSRSCPF